MNPENMFTPYGLCGVSGVLAGFVYIFVLSRRDRKRMEDLIYVYVWAAVGAIAGAKILYLLVESGNIIRALDSGQTDVGALLTAIITGGFVFYGGLLGALLFAYLAARFFSLDIAETLDDLIPAMALAHAFGRIGCHLTGCCYGKEVSGFPGITYHASQYAPNGVSLFPVQITEAAGDIIIFIILIIIRIKKKDREKGSQVTAYLVMYAVMRFVLEFFRGDAARGFIGFFSTSQWISVVIMMVCAVIMFKGTRTAQNRNEGANHG